jgi:hypothetical protein
MPLYYQFRQRRVTVVIIFKYFFNQMIKHCINLTLQDLFLRMWGIRILFALSILNSMKKITKVCPLALFVLLLLTPLLFFSACTTNKQHFSFSPAPPAYVKKQTLPAENIIAAKKTIAETDKTMLTASSAPAQSVLLPEVAALSKAETQPTLAAATALAAKASSAAPEVKASQKLTLAQKVVLHKVKKQVKNLENQAQAAAGPVTNRNAIALILIGIVVAVFATLVGGGLANLLYTLGILLLLVGLVLLILNYV